MTLYSDLVAITEPHDQIGLLAAVGFLATALLFPAFSAILIVLAVILIVAVIVDLTAHGWNH